MINPVNRRRFLRQAALGGLSLGLPWFLTGCAGTVRQQEQSQVSVRSASGSGSPLLVLHEPVSADVEPRAPAWIYLEEVLQHAGLFYSRLRTYDLQKLHGHAEGVLLLAGNLRLSPDQQSLITDWVTQGGTVIGIGGTSGLHQVFGISSGLPLAEGWITITAAQHPITRGLRSSLHVFGGFTLKPAKGSVLAEIQGANGQRRGAAIVEHAIGRGRAVLLGPDLLFSVVHIQQGIPVLQDGHPALDGSAEINEGTLKAEDGLVLDWQRDRTAVPPDNGRIFLGPIADELREIILRSIFYLAHRQGLTLPMLWYWPKALPAVAMMSHDTDGNEPAKAEELLAVLNRAEIKSTWCLLYPGGYPADFYQKLTNQDFEVALHFDAHTGGKQTSWSRENFLLQHQWLLKEAGLQRIHSNKNHYTRWEGRLDFFRWCEEAGIEADQTRGPSKKGTIGFPLGGSHPYMPLDNERASPRFIDVLEINLLTQDHVVTCPPEYGQQLTDTVLRHHGVAHFLFHPAHITKPGVAEALIGLTEYAKARGMEWWTCQRISDWERCRRGVHVSYPEPGLLEFRSARTLSNATLLFLRAGSQANRLVVDGKAVPAKTFEAYGFEFDSVTVEIKGTVPVEVRG